MTITNLQEAGKPRVSESDDKIDGGLSQLRVELIEEAVGVVGGIRSKDLGGGRRGVLEKKALGERLGGHRQEDRLARQFASLSIARQTMADSSAPIKRSLIVSGGGSLGVASGDQRICPAVGSVRRALRAQKFRRRIRAAEVRRASTNTGGGIDGGFVGFGVGTRSHHLRKG